jgi:transposase-like protein
MEIARPRPPHAPRRAGRVRDERDLPALRRALAVELPPPGAGAKGDPLEARAKRFLQALRWPDGVECPRCGESRRLLWLDSRARWNCYACRYQFSVTAGTLFHGSHLPVWKWLVGVQLMTESDGISANELRRRLGGSYKTWWFTAHRIRVAIAGSTGAFQGDLPRRHRSDRYRVAYMHEQRWRAAKGGSPGVFGDTVRDLLEGEGLSYRKLTGQPAAPAERRAAA